MKKRIALSIAVLMTAFFVFAPASLAASAGSADPIQTVNNLSDFIFTAIKAIGVILLGFGIVQVGLSLKGHDPSQRANVRPE